MKNLHIDLIRVTEAGAIAASEWVGRGDKESADKAATDAIRSRLNKIDFRAEIAIGEGEKDKSHGLFEGELVGTGANYATPYSIAIDPIEGTTPVAKGGYEAMSVIAMGEKDCLYRSNYFYMDKIAVGKGACYPASEGLFSDVSLLNSPEENVNIVAKALGKQPQHITVCVLDRPRTKELIEELRKIGCRIKFIGDCDVTACIAACVPDSGIDMFWSIGGAPEAVIAACAMKSMGGYLECREVDLAVPIPKLYMTDDSKILRINDLAKGEVMFAATGITDGQLLKGVRYTTNGPKTNSMAMRSESGTIRNLVTEHGN